MSERTATPWGWVQVWADAPGLYTGKLMQVLAGHRLSLQYHQRKDETLLCLEGDGTLHLGDDVVRMLPGVAVRVRPGQHHRLVAGGDLLVAEVSTHDDGDVVRLEDDYGRA